MKKLQIYEVEYDRSSSKQILAEFSCGTPPDGASFKYDFYKSNSHSDHRKIVCETPYMKYIADNKTSDPTTKYLNKYIAIVNKRTSKIRVYNAEIFKFCPITGLENEINEEEERIKAMQKVEKDERSYSERSDVLTEAFGSKHKQKAMVSRQRNNISDTTTAITEAVETMVEMGKDFTISINEETSIFKCNYDAEKPEDVYKFNDIIPENIRKACLDQAKSLLNPQKSEIESWRKDNDIRGKSYIAWHATHTHSAVRANETIHHEYVCCLQLMVYLSTIYKYRKSKKTPFVKLMLQDADRTIQHWASDEFSIDGSAMPQRCKDKILATAIIIAWHIDSFQFDLQPLCDLFTLSLNKLSTIVRALGGNVNSVKKGDSSTSIAVLKTPVIKPKPRSDVLKRKRR